MSDDRVQYRYQLPPHYADVPEAAEYMEREARRRFGEALFDWVKDNNGGIVGPIHVREESQDDILFRSGIYKTVTMYCSVTRLPVPPEFRLMGGPADGLIVRTGGERIWKVPMAPPMPSVLAYGDDPTTQAGPRFAEYERVGHTQGYRFVRVGL